MNGATHPAATRETENAHPGTEAEQPALLDVGPTDLPAFATLVSNDGRLIRLSNEGGQIAIAIDGRKPVVLDRWQSIALRAAFAELGA